MKAFYHVTNSKNNIKNIPIDLLYEITSVNEHNVSYHSRKGKTTRDSSENQEERRGRLSIL